MTWQPRNKGRVVNRRHGRRLMCAVRLMPICEEPDTGRPAKGHRTWPCLPDGLRVERPDQVWCADIACVPIRKGLPCLVASVDRFAPKVAAWRISDTCEADGFVEAPDEANRRFGLSEFMNTDQGSRFTCFARTDWLGRIGSPIPLDGKGRCLDIIAALRSFGASHLADGP
ncbi:MAG: DDE-type integrase/transposase/recombinase [Tabrizicola sp.]